MPPWFMSWDSVQNLTIQSGDGTFDRICIEREDDTVEDFGI